jgi:acyl-CoA reductase-like NAD-dependent aldehyde dehydrogenase
VGVIRVRDEDEAVRIADDSVLGVGWAVFTCSLTAY